MSEEEREEEEKEEEKIVNRLFSAPTPAPVPACSITSHQSALRGRSGAQAKRRGARSHMRDRAHVEARPFDLEALLSLRRAEQSKSKKKGKKEKKGKKGIINSLTSGDLDTLGLKVLRVAGGHGAPLADLLELVDLLKVGGGRWKVPGGGAAGGGGRRFKVRREMKVDRGPRKRANARGASEETTKGEQMLPSSTGNVGQQSLCCLFSLVREKKMSPLLSSGGSSRTIDGDEGKRKRDQGHEPVALARQR